VSSCFESQNYQQIYFAKSYIIFSAVRACSSSIHVSITQNNFSAAFPFQYIGETTKREMEFGEGLEKDTKHFSARYRVHFFSISLSSGATSQPAANNKSIRERGAKQTETQSAAESTISLASNIYLFFTSGALLLCS